MDSKNGEITHSFNISLASVPEPVLQTFWSLYFWQLQLSLSPTVRLLCVPVKVNELCVV